MSADQPPALHGWEERYQQQAVETMPWFYPQLDDDLRQALDQLGLRAGAALDLGTGPGTQAIQLARRGFEVTATDISAAAIRLAREKAIIRGLHYRTNPVIVWTTCKLRDCNAQYRLTITFRGGDFRHSILLH